MSGGLDAAPGDRVPVRDADLPAIRVEFVRGEGATLWDADGKAYVDLFSGLSVHNAGNCNPEIVAAISEQAATLGGTSNLFYSEPAMQLTERLVESSLGGRAFLCNSGAEADECAIKLVRRHAHARGIDRPEIVVLDFAFHGRTMAALAATPRLAREDLFGPLPEGFVPVPRDDPDALRAAVGAATAAVMIEPIQGESGDPPDRRRACSSPPARPATRPERCSSSTRSRPAWGGRARSGPTNRARSRPM